MATGSRLRRLLRPLLSSPSPLPQRQAHLLYSSSSDYGSCRSRSLLSDDQEERVTGSAVYRHTLRTQRPPTIRRQKELVNSANFIGRVNSPLKAYTRYSGALCAHTQLKVESPAGSKKFITILLDMWEDMAELCLQHLKPDDYIYVSGYLKSSTKARDDGNLVFKLKVIVQEINYIANNNHKTETIKDKKESSAEKQRNRLHLWQVFFANPYEWRDLRKCKMNPKQPDFKHKGSDEALWIKPHDPPWIHRQLQLQDSRMSDMCLDRNPIYNLKSFATEL